MKKKLAKLTKTGKNTFINKIACYANRRWNKFDLLKSTVEMSEKIFVFWIN